MSETKILGVVELAAGDNTPSKFPRLHLEESNIESRPLWKPMHMQPIFNDETYYGQNLAETLFENGLCMPSGSNLNEDDRERIKNSIQNMKILKN